MKVTLALGLGYSYFNNFFIDLSVAVYGRGVLFSLASPLLFFVILIKDFSRALWHWGSLSVTLIPSTMDEDRFGCY